VTVLNLAVYRLATAVSSDGQVATERVEVRPPIRYDSVNPAPDTMVKVQGFPPCTCPQAPACREREAERPRPPRRPSPAAAAPAPDTYAVRAGLDV
jgi:hypothetical protein